MADKIYTEEKKNYNVKVVLIEKNLEQFTKGGSTDASTRGDIIFFLYDVTSEESFQNAMDVFTFVDRGNDSAVMYLVGNCCDKGSRVIPIEKGRESIGNASDGYFKEISVKDGTGVKELLDEAVHHFLTSETEKIRIKRNGLNVVEPKSGGCCVLL